MSSETRSLSSLIQAREREAFVGRTHELDAYRAFLARDPSNADSGYAVIFSIHGPSGIGKSWLLRRLQELTHEAGVLAPWIDQTDRDVVEVMRHIALELDAKKKFKKYLAADKRYQQLKSEISNDPKAPEGLLSFLAQSTAKSVTLAAREAVPGANVALEFLDEERVTEGASAYLAYLAGKARSTDSVQLLRRPIEVLTPLFLDGLRAWARDHKSAVVHIDTYERLRPYVDSWLRAVLEGQHGEFPVGIRFAIAGQDSLNDRDWVGFGGLVKRRALEVFSVEEGTAYLRARGIADERAQQRRLEQSGRLPLALAMLGSGDGAHDPASGSIAEAYVGSITDPTLRALVLRCSLARVLNQDVVARLAPEGQVADAGAHWDWLRRQHFVEQRRDGWTYHEAARNALCELQRMESPETFQQTHEALLQYYDGKLRALGTGRETVLTIAGRRLLLELIYHGLCFDFDRRLDQTLLAFTEIMFNDLAFAYQIASAVTDAQLNADARSTLDPLDLKEVADPDLTVNASLPAMTRLTSLETLPTRARLRFLNLRADWLEALEYFEMALADANTAESLTTSTDFLRLSQARLLVTLGRHDEALPKLNALAELPADEDQHFRANVLALRARAIDAIEGPEQALTDWDAALTLTPTSGAALMNYGLGLVRAARPSEAAMFFEKAGTMDPELRSISLARIAECHRRAGEPDRGLALLESHLRADPTDATLWSFYVDQLGYTELSQDAVVERLLAVDCREQFDACYQQARCAASVHPELGVSLLQQVLGNRTPTMAQHNRLGLTLNEAGMHEAAYHEFELALESDPSSLFVLYNLAVAAKLRWGTDYNGPEIDQLHDAINTPYLPAAMALYAKAGIAAASNDREEAIQFLAGAAQLDRGGLEWIDGDAAWAAHRDDPRVVALIGDLLLVGDLSFRKT